MGNYKTINRLKLNHYSVSAILVIACVSSVTTNGQSTTQTSTTASNTVAALASNATAAKQLSSESTPATQSRTTTIGQVKSATSSTSDSTAGVTSSISAISRLTYTSNITSVVTTTISKPPTHSTYSSTYSSETSAQSTQYSTLPSSQSTSESRTPTPSTSLPTTPVLPTSLASPQSSKHTPQSTQTVTSQKRMSGVQSSSASTTITSGTTIHSVPTSDIPGSMTTSSSTSKHTSPSTSSMNSQTSTSTKRTTIHSAPMERTSAKETSGTSGSMPTSSSTSKYTSLSTVTVVPETSNSSLHTSSAASTSKTGTTFHSAPMGITSAKVTTGKSGSMTTTISQPNTTETAVPGTTTNNTSTIVSTTLPITEQSTSDPCLFQSCENGGTCVSVNGSVTCNCGKGFTGPNCTVDIDDCIPSPCENNGTCTDMVNGFKCTCIVGFNGTKCEKNIDECAPTPCENGGFCKDLVNDYLCTCVQGYTGSRCETDINECKSQPCENKGNCTDLIDGYQCVCSSGYTGTRCETDIDECQNHPCLHGGTCTDLVDGFSCSCQVGYNGTMCENDIDDCVGVLCQNGGTCNDKVNNYTCSCAVGWQGRHCETDLDECAIGTHRCHKFAQCTNTVGNYTCECKNGFSGDGYSCSDINECSNSSLYNCKNNGTCFNLFGSYACICLPGWTGPSCENDIDECSSTNNPCSVNETCSNGLGSYNCTCKNGYRSDGDLCIYEVLYDLNFRYYSYEWSDDEVVHVPLLQGIQYFGKTYFRAYVNMNGFISLGQKVDYKNPPTSHLNWPKDVPVIAPLWTDLQPRMSNSHSRMYVYVVDRKTIIDKLFEDFEPKIVLVVTWKNVAPYPEKLTFDSERSDFQVLLASNGTYTRLVYNYDQTRFRIKPSPGREVVIGYSNGTFGQGIIQFTKGHFTDAKHNSNIGIPGRWVFNVSSSSDNVTKTAAQCRNWALNGDIMFFLEFLPTEPCPCTLSQAWRDNRFRYTGTTKDYISFRSIFVKSQYGTLQHCNYYTNGSLIIGAPNGGYPTINNVKLAPRLEIDEGYKHCCGTTQELCYLFYTTHPSDTCRHYTPPSWASGWGDPHVRTLDGAEYTFNGLGEFVLARTKFLEVQVRTERVAANNFDATVFVGIAAQDTYGDIIELLLHRNNQTYDVFINSILNTSFPSADSIFIQANNCAIWNTSDGFVLSFRSGFSMKVDVSDIFDIVAFAPKNESQLANMTGLLGNNDGDPNNDFVMRNLTILPPTSKEQELVMFGMSWMVQDKNESLFHYSTGKDFYLINNRTVQPHHFISDGVGLASYLNTSCPAQIRKQDVIDSCKNNTACVVDYALTCNEQFGLRTLQTQTKTEENIAVLENNPPDIKAFPPSIQAMYGNTTRVIFRVTDDKDTSITVKLTTETSMEHSFTKQNETTWIFDWNVTGNYFDDTIPLPYINLIAMDSMNSSSAYRPDIYFCNCTDPTDCTFDMGNVNTGNDHFYKEVCECGRGKTGPFCEPVIDRCNENPCYDPSKCLDVMGEAIHCGLCPDGLSGDGIKCYDIDECEAADAVCSQICINLLGSYKCGCEEGYVLSADNSTCEDIDECKVVPNRCSSDNSKICANTIGSYECVCRPGYIKDSDKCRLAISQFVGELSWNIDNTQNKDVATILKTFLTSIFNETQISLISIEIVRLSKHRSRRMRAFWDYKDARYILNSERPLATGVVEETWLNYTNGPTCFDGICKVFDSGVGIKLNATGSRIYKDGDNMLCSVQSNRCDSLSTICSSLNGVVLCSCKEGYSPLQNYRDRCEDINECVSSPCIGGTCTNIPGNFTCHCPAGYGFVAGACKDPCNPLPCLNGGECIHGNEENSYICKCDDNWAGQTCERKNEETSRLQTTLIAVGASVGGLCFLLLLALFGLYRRNKKKYDSYLQQRAMSSIHGFENSKLRYNDAPFDDAIGNDFSIPRPKVTSDHYEMRETDSDIGLLNDEEEQAKFDDPSKPRREADRVDETGQTNQAFSHSENSSKIDRHRSKNSYEYF